MSNFSSMALSERMVLAKRQAANLNRSACRNLFGAIDHEELRRDLKKQLKEIQASDCQRWNFDFKTETPLKGRFLWETLDGKEMPTFYRETRLAQGGPGTAQQAKELSSFRSLPKDRQEDKQTGAERLRPDIKGNEENQREQIVGSKMVASASVFILYSRKKYVYVTTLNHCFTDFFPKRKRTGAGKVLGESAEVSFPGLPAEQTSRRRIR
uniref:Cyclin-dependent kinase inhibitor domain-containing protein n=1 Tax=Latimeria chalumnae TaxID=7897 RepID=H3B2T8_LATCH